MTVNELAKLCEKVIKEGDGDKDIYISNDDEGNGYHFLYYGFSKDVEELDTWGSIDDAKNAIILG